MYMQELCFTAIPLLYESKLLCEAGKTFVVVRALDVNAVWNLSLTPFFTAQLIIQAGSLVPRFLLIDLHCFSLHPVFDASLMP